MHRGKELADDSVDNRRRSTILLYIDVDGGTGKSRVIHALCYFLTELKTRNMLKLCATTGASTDNMNRFTVHYILRLKIEISGPVSVQRQD